jgi:hypothetical protein
MSSSLIPERPLLISPTLAATIGLEEAVLLHVISELLLQHPPLWRQQRRWAEISDATLYQALPFWNSEQVQRILRSLQSLGLVLGEAVPTRPQNRLLAINQPDTAAPRDTAAAAPAAQPSPFQTPAFRPSPAAAAATHPASPRPQPGLQAGTGGAATPIPADWRPDATLLQLCAQRNVPQDFIEREVPAFVLYWRERGKLQYSWQQTFLNWIVTRWEKQRSFQGARELETTMHPGWLPSEEAVSILEHAGISLSFIEDAVPEFVLYWRERGVSNSEWNSKFIAHVRRQWVKYTHALEHDTTPRPIPPDFQPDPACLDVLAMANIDLDFALAQLPEFILYWQDRKEAHGSWNTKFLQHVKFRWAQQMQPAGQPLLERLTDRSWAD